MTLDQFLAELEALAKDATQAFADASDASSLEAARVEFLGAAKGRLKSVQKGLGAVGKEDKPAAGKRFNEVKTAVEAAFAAAQERIQSAGTAKKDGPQFDPTLPGVENNPQARLTLEQQVTPDITFTYITNVTTSNPQIVRVEWSVSKQWSVVALREENGVYSLDFFYKKRF